MRRFTNINYYSLLGVMSDATRDEIRTAYRAKVRIVHPDRGGDPEVFAQIAEAWEVLGNESERIIYDADHKLRMRTARPYQSVRLSREEADPAGKSSAGNSSAVDADLEERFGEHQHKNDGTARFDSRKQWMENKRRLDHLRDD